MLKIVVLICSIMVPPERCDRRHAIDINLRSVPFGAVGLDAQIEMAGGARGPDPYHYEKIIEVRR